MGRPGNWKYIIPVGVVSAVFIPVVTQRRNAIRTRNFGEGEIMTGPQQCWKTRMYKTFARPLLFMLNPEDAHSLTIRGCRLAGDASRMWRSYVSRPADDFSLAIANSVTVPSESTREGDDILSQTIWGRKFRKPVGIAAGFDKNASAASFLISNNLLDLGHLEVSFTLLLCISRSGVYLESHGPEIPNRGFSVSSTTAQL